MSRHKEYTIHCQDPHVGQWRAFEAFEAAPNGLLALQCGRRWGKTDYLQMLAVDVARTEPVGWFAPSYKVLSEAYQGIVTTLDPIKSQSSEMKGVIRTLSGGRVDFWTLEDERAGRSRMYKLVVIDEGAFTKPNMMDIWERSIKPTLLDLGGRAIVASNTNGIDGENFFWQICNEEKYGFSKYHAPTFENPHLPRRMPGESEESHAKRRLEVFEKLKADNDPLVFSQEFLAEFVDWSGVAFFSIDRLLQLNGQPYPWPTLVDQVYATIDTSTKTGMAHDGTAVVYWGLSSTAPVPLMILDWDIVQFEGASLEVWLPTVLENLAALTDARNGGIRCRVGSTGAHIEDQNAGTILIQHAANKGWPAYAIESGLTAMGKDGRAISVSGQVYRRQVGITQRAYDKTVNFKGQERNHLRTQVTGFKVGDPHAAKRADDLLDCFSYGVAIGLGNSEGFA